MKNFLKVLAAALGFLVSLAAAASVAILVFRPGWVEAAVGWLSARFAELGAWNYAVAFGAVALDGVPVVGTLVPGDKVFVVAAGLWTGGNFWLLAAAAYAGALAGNALSYALGRAWGPWLVKEFGIWFGLGETEVARVRGGLEKNGFWFVLASKFHNAFRWAVPFVVGAAGLPARKFFWGNLVASALWVAALGALGKLAFAHYQEIIKYAGWAITGLLLAVLLWAAVFRREALVRYWKEKEAEIDARLGAKK